jgi:peptidoglycan/LPS O-acetylase OafA/YrhL
MTRSATAEVRDKARSPLVLLQSLRAIAALMVVLDHIHLQRGKVFPDMTYWPHGTVCGEAGVDLFFVISGFIMMHITPRAHRSWRDQGAFLFRRAVRIYPPYWAVVIPLLLLWQHDPGVLNAYNQHQVDVVSSLLLTPSRRAVVLIVAWSLVAELSYYLISSFIFYWEGRRRLAVILAWAVVVFGYSLIAIPGKVGPFVAVFLRTITLEFIAGMFLAHVLMHQHHRISPRLAILAIPLAAVVIFAWGSWHGIYLPDQDALPRLVFYGLPAVLLVGLVVQMDLQHEWGWLQSLAPLGDRSYAIYLVHFPVIAAFYRLAGKLPLLHSILGPLVEAAGLGTCLWITVEGLHRLVEKPSHSLARRLSSLFSGKRRGNVGGESLASSNASD